MEFEFKQLISCKWLKKKKPIFSILSFIPLLNFDPAFLSSIAGASQGTILAAVGYLTASLVHHIHDKKCL